MPAEKFTGRLDSVLSARLSINMYMFHGGTTRGFMNGANYDDSHPYEPQVSSYDYDAPLDEAGNATPKFILFRKVIAKHLPEGKILPAVPPAKPAIKISSIKLRLSASIFSNLPAPISDENPLTFEQLNQAYGFVLYHTVLSGGRTGILKLDELRDYAIIMVNGKRVGVLDRRKNQDSLSLKLPKGVIKLDILVENLGRINFGSYLLKNHKGITKDVIFDGKIIYNWKMYRFPFQTLENIHYTAGKVSNMPVIEKGTFNLSSIGDTYLDMSNWGKGVAWINGHNLDRYWSVGPQQTLYVPGEWLKKGQNTIVVFELLNSETDLLNWRDTPILNKLQ